MLTIFKTNEKILDELPIASTCRGCWINLIKPTMGELKVVSETTDIPLDLLMAALDEEERPRIELEDNSILIVNNIPTMEDENSFDTLPLGIIASQDFIITVCLRDNKIISYFNNDNAKYFDTNKKTRFLLQILYRSARLYLRYLRMINKHTDEIELNLRRTMKNKALFQLLELEKSLVYFATALKDNRLVTERLMRLLNNGSLPYLRMYEDDSDLLEDVIIENKQALDMVEMHSNILSSMMDAFASIISNNLNMVMKFLTAMTILLAIPTMLSSFWGMNVNVPWGHSHPYGFIFVALISISITAATAFILLRKNIF